MVRVAGVEPDRRWVHASAERPVGGEPVVIVKELVKRFPVRRGWVDLLGHPLRRAERRVAVDAVSFEVQRGELFGLLGPNGAGKTTLLKMLSTLIEPDGGEAIVVGARLTREREAVRRVVAPVIADERSLNWRVSAYENLRLYGRLYGIDRLRLGARVEEVLEVVGLSTAGAKLVGAFSSGMRQRLLIARALLAEPEILILDEPTRSLDPMAARDLRAFLKSDITGSRGRTILLATHDPEEGLRLCDRIAVLDRGRLVATGSPEELMTRVAADRYRLLTREPEHPALQAWGAGMNGERPRGRSAGWTAVDIAIPGDEAAAHAALASIVRQGVSVARFEKVQPELPELIEGLLREGEHGGL